MKSIFLWFILNNSLFSLPLYFYDKTFSVASFSFISFFTLLWISIDLINIKLISKKSTDSEIAFISFAVNITYKFLMSLLFLAFVIYLYKALDMKFSVILFVLYYFQYTFLILKFGRNKIL
jgi:hypothetical protein